jgi:hypothetical protein
MNDQDRLLAQRIIDEAKGLLERLNSLPSGTTEQRNELRRIRTQAFALIPRLNGMLLRSGHSTIEAPTIDMDLWNTRIRTLLTLFLGQLQETLEYVMKRSPP